MLTAVILIFTVFSCELFLDPPNPRENPNDPANPTPPVFDFRTFGSGPNSVILKWQFDPEINTTADVLILRNSTAAPSSINDGTVVYEGRPEPGEDGYFFITDTSAGLDSDYYYAIWAFTGPEDERLFNGPIIDEATTKLQAETVSPSSDGHVKWDNGPGSTKDFKLLNLHIQYNPGTAEYYMLFTFDFEDAPDFGSVYSASLRLYFDFSNLAAATWDVHARRITTAWDEGEPAADLYTKIVNGIYDPASGSTVQINSDSYNYYYWPVQDIIEDWLTGQQPGYGIIVYTDTIGTDYFEFYSSEYSVWEMQPVLELSYYGDPPTEMP